MKTDFGLLLCFLVPLVAVHGIEKWRSRGPWYGAPRTRAMTSAKQAAKLSSLNARNLDGVFEHPGHWAFSPDQPKIAYGRGNVMYPDPRLLEIVRDDTAPDQCDRFDEQPWECRRSHGPSSCDYCCSDSFCYNDLREAPDCILPGPVGTCASNHCGSLTTCDNTGCIPQDPSCFGPTRNNPPIYSRNFCDSRNLVDRNQILYAADPTPQYLCYTRRDDWEVENELQRLYIGDRDLFRKLAYFYSHSITITIPADGTYFLVMGIIELAGTAGTRRPDTPGQRIPRKMTARLNGHLVFSFNRNRYARAQLVFHRLQFTVRKNVQEMKSEKVLTEPPSRIVNNRVVLSMSSANESDINQQSSFHFIISTLYVARL